MCYSFSFLLSLAAASALTSTAPWPQLWTRLCLAPAMVPGADIALAAARTSRCKREISRKLAVAHRAWAEAMEVETSRTTGVDMDLAKPRWGRPHKVVTVSIFSKHRTQDVAPEGLALT